MDKKSQPALSSHLTISHITCCFLLFSHLMVLANTFKQNISYRAQGPQSSPRFHILVLKVVMKFINDLSFLFIQNQSNQNRFFLHLEVLFNDCRWVRRLFKCWRGPDPWPLSVDRTPSLTWPQTLQLSFFTELANGRAARLWKVMREITANELTCQPNSVRANCAERAFCRSVSIHMVRSAEGVKNLSKSNTYFQSVQFLIVTWAHLFKQSWCTLNC